MPEKYEAVQLHGLDEVDRKLKMLPERVRRKHLKNILKDAAEDFQDEAIRRVPKRKIVSGWMAFIEDPGGGGPSLKDHIVYKVTVGKEKAVAIVGIDYSKVHHGHLVEFGAKPHWISIPKTKGKRRWHHKGAPKQPFMRPAFDSRASSVLSNVSAKLIKAVESEV